ncbi:MAG: serine/threonine-protein kinase [Myxococcota bacterium]|nr:serine/threonine-protein kinase [Myxococcota bacterium]
MSINEQKIGPYRILYRLGKGGSSEVFAARGPWEQKVAIKIQRRPKKRRRFLQELDIPNSFSHPCLTPIYAFGITSDGWSYLVMDIIEGISAASYSRKIPVPNRTKESVRICSDIAEALGKLHEQNWIHGDIKSKNILVDAKGKAYLIDFELARPLNETGKGGFFGTRSYSPPEQHEGKRLTPSVDVYALASVLCRMISGDLPYDRYSNDKQAQNRRSIPPKLPKEIPQRLYDLLQRALSPYPKRRPSNGTVFAKELRRSLSLSPTKPETSKVYTLSLMATLLKDKGLNVRSYLPHLYYFSGGSQSLAHLFADHKKQNDSRSWVPSSFGKKWRKKLYEYPPKSIQCMILLAALGGNLRSSILASAIEGSTKELGEQLSQQKEILVYENGRWSLRFGALDSIILNHPNAVETLKLLNSPKIQGLVYCKIARYISRGNFMEACMTLKSWIDEEADTIRQWVFLQRLMRKGVSLEHYRKILLCRLDGDWIAALHLQANQDAKNLLKCLESINYGSFHIIGTIQKLCRSSRLDVMIGARALYAEWHIANGRFHEAVQKLKLLCKSQDIYPQNIGLQQRALMHSHLAQKLMRKKVSSILEQWSTNDSHRKLVERIRDGEFNQHFIPMDRLRQRIPYLKACHELKQKKPDLKCIQALPFSLSLRDRAALLSNPIWRSYEKELGLPPAPK